MGRVIFVYDSGDDTNIDVPDEFWVSCLEEVVEKLARYAWDVEKAVEHATRAKRAP